MSVHEWATAIASVGGLTGLAALLSALAALRTSKQAENSADKAHGTSQAIIGELKPNHGSSLRDAVDQLDRKTDLLAEEVTVLARSMDATNGLIRDRLNSIENQLKTKE